MSIPLSALVLVATSTTMTSSVGPEAQEDLEGEFAQALAGSELASTANAPTPPSALATVRLIDIALDLLAAGGGSSSRENELRLLEGGGHDPKNRGFTVQNVELTFAGVVDPYLRGDAHIVLLIDPTGETVIELEEVYLTTLALPANLQLKAGQFFTAFGRLNPIHPHSWDFVDQPVVNTRFLGPDGLRNVGAQVSWLTPLPFFLELYASLQDSHGETATSFRNAPEEEIAGRVLLARDVRGILDLLYLGRARASFDLGEETTLMIGVSGLFGPNASAQNTYTTIGGADLTLKWKPLDAEQGWPFVAIQTEAMVRAYQVPLDTLEDFGLYAQASWGFSRPYTLALRYDFARGEAMAFDDYRSADDPFRDERHRISAALSYFPSEFSKLRLQYTYDHASFLPDGESHSLYLQAEILFGAHGAHKF